jgi:hypothetical protein
MRSTVKCRSTWRRQVGRSISLIRANPLDGLVHVVHQKTIFTVFDQFRHAAPVKGDHGCTAGHGFDNGQTERLIKLDGVQQRTGFAEQPVALNGSDAADIYTTLSLSM